MSESNLEGIVTEIEGLYRRYTRSGAYTAARYTVKVAAPSLTAWATMRAPGARWDATSHADVNDIITQSILEACTGTSSLLDALLLVYGACLGALSILIGAEVGACVAVVSPWRADCD